MSRSISVMSHRAANERGFSAVELMVSMTVMGILMLGFLTVFPLGMRTVQKGENLSAATSLVQDEIERIKSLSITDADLVAGTHDDPANPIQGVYTRSWTVIDDTPMAGMKTVNILVSYADGGVPRNIQMSTYLTE